MMIVTYLSVTTIIIDQKISREHGVDVELVGAERVVPGEGLAEGVDRRRADIAEDDADRADGQLVERALPWPCAPGHGPGLRLRRLQSR